MVLGSVDHVLEVTQNTQMAGTCHLNTDRKQKWGMEQTPASLQARLLSKKFPASPHIPPCLGIKLSLDDLSHRHFVSKSYLSP